MRARPDLDLREIDRERAPLLWDWGLAARHDGQRVVAVVEQPLRHLREADGAHAKRAAASRLVCL